MVFSGIGSHVREVIPVIPFSWEMQSIGETAETVLAANNCL